MDPRLLRYYNEELQHLREMGAEFAQAFPKIASRLGIDGIEVSDPYVERLVESFAFLAGRVQLKLDAQFPRFTQRLLDVVYPQLLAPTPSMLIAHLQQDLNDANLAQGLVIPRGSELRSVGQRLQRATPVTEREETTCRFRTSHDLVLWPIELTQVEYFTHAADLPLAESAQLRGSKAGLRIRLKATAGLDFAKISMDSLRLHCAGMDDLAYRLHELIVGNALGVLVVPSRGSAAKWSEVLPAENIQPIGYEDEHALLPVGLRGFHSYRLLQEFFGFPQRFLFFDLLGLGPLLRRHGEGADQVDIVILFDRADAALDQAVGTDSLSLNCVPAVNLFEHRCDHIHVTSGLHDYHVIADRTRPADYEIYELTELVGHGIGIHSERLFLPLYSTFHTENRSHDAFYTAQREPRVLSIDQQRHGTRSAYVGSEMFVSIVDQREAPYSSDLRQLAPKALCSNRDLPMLMNLGGGSLRLDTSTQVQAIRVVKGPSRPVSSLQDGNAAWRLVNQLSLNHLSLLDVDAQQGAAALRELLALYAVAGDASAQRMIDGVRSVTMQPSVRRLPMPGPIAFGRGVRIDVHVDDLAFQGNSAFLLGSVLEHFFARHASINAFTETLMHSQARGEIHHWEPRCGMKPIL